MSDGVQVEPFHEIIVEGFPRPELVDGRAVQISVVESRHLLRILLPFLLFRAWRSCSGSRSGEQERAAPQCGLVQQDHAPRK